VFSKRFTVIAVVAMAALSVWALFFRSSAPVSARPTAGSRVIAFGDSLVAGNGTTAGGDFTSVLAQRLGVPILNAGRPGDTTATALDRIDADVLSRDPRVVIVLLGGNDLIRRAPREQTVANLRSIVERIRARGAAVILVGFSVGWFDPLTAELRRIADETSAVFVPDVLDDVIGRADRMADAIHPNNAGHKIMADRIEPVLRDLVR
jgi:lysophospholipase L1-like esterase